MNAPVCLSLAAALSMAAAPAARFTVAIVRFDGRIVPFAAYWNGRWEHAWPAADEAVARTRSIQSTPSVWRRHGQPVPRAWHVWPASGAPPIDAHVNGVEVVEAGCLEQVALTTDLPVAKAEGPQKFGVAVDSPLPIDAVEEVAQSDAEWTLAQRVVLDNFTRLEAAEARAARKTLVRESPAPLPQIRRLYRQVGAPRSPMYVVAEKKYRTGNFPEDPQCAAVTIVTGWLMPNADGTSTLGSARVFVTNCDEKEARTAAPLATFRVARQLFWVLTEHGYEDEGYVIAEITPKATRYVVAVGGGGC
jgi:hypothetical protein